MRIFYGRVIFPEEKSSQQDLKKKIKTPAITQQHKEAFQKDSACDGIIYRTEKLFIQKDYKTSDENHTGLGYFSRAGVCAQVLFKIFK